MNVVAAPPEHVQIAWLCMWRLQHGTENNGEIFMPSAVSKALLRRGWIEEAGDGHNITAAGVDITDLHGPDWGINTLGDPE